jgi:hypothetical protein
MSRPVRLERCDVFRFRCHTEPISAGSVAFVLRQNKRQVHLRAISRRPTHGRPTSPGDEYLVDAPN